MKKTVRFLIVLIAAFLLMLVFRSVGVTLYTVEGDGLSPSLIAGDRVLVNRWSYGLRIGGSRSLFNYGRICKQPIAKGDLVAFENPLDSAHHEVFVCRCVALPGDSLMVDGVKTVVPCLDNCATADYYWMMGDNRHNSADSRYWGFVPEDHVVGKPIFIWWSSDPDRSLFGGGIRWGRLFSLVDNIK